MCGIASVDIDESWHRCYFGLGACDHFFVNSGGITSLGRYWLQGGHCGNLGDGGLFNMDDYSEAGDRTTIGACFL